ncbi:MAG: OmpA family protein [Methyloversatilis sp.]|jgi:outer membrane protein OmpA-like peptidoglycan-associated protein|uniref:OmpA family protein n=1 Tax=Methyloversatilis TaxID=378210 RepID=UPI0003783AD1|nr:MULTISPECIES: OmpA family protein [Methyloversatilis]MCR6667308.1 OmpA family protein [Methyloversatilis sp.]
MKKTLILLTAGALVATGCANMTETQKRTTIGTGVGAAAGAALGSAVGGSGGATRSGALIGAAVGGIGTYIWSQKMEEQKRAMEQATAGTGVDVVQTADNQLKLEIPSDISFDVGRADIKPNFRPVLDRFAQTLNANPTTTVRIIGHTDSTGSDAVNDPLSVNRAASARNYLADRGVASSRIVIDGRGSHEPLADNGSEAGRAKNRRVEIFVGEPGK